MRDRIGLTFGATSTLLNRLERAGHVVRSRVHTDRRIVTLHSTPNVQAIAEEHFEPLGRRIAAVLKGHSTDFIAEFVRLLDNLRHTMEAYIDETADRPEGGADRS